jgi:hypothetical protein
MVSFSRRVTEGLAYPGCPRLSSNEAAIYAWLDGQDVEYLLQASLGLVHLGVQVPHFFSSLLSLLRGPWGRIVIRDLRIPKAWNWSNLGWLSDTRKSYVHMQQVYRGPRSHVWDVVPMLVK